MTRTVIMASLATLYWHPPLKVGTDHVLPPCPDTPAAALARAKAALLAEPRTTLTEEREGYLHAECKSFVFRFVDDVDRVVDPVAHVYRFRSASRLGRSDLGVNRTRIARISARLALPANPSN